MNIRFRRKNKNGDNSYEVRVPLSNDQNKKLVRWTTTIRAKTLQSARRMAAKMQREGKIPQDYTSCSSAAIPSSFEEFVEIWKETHYPMLAKKTKRNYTSILKNYLLPYFASRPLKKLNTDDIRRFIQYLTKSKLYKTPTGQLSATMISKCYRLLSEILTDATEKNFIAKNPCSDLVKQEIPVPAYKATTIWQPEELKTFLLHLQSLEDTYHNFQKKVMFNTILMTGMRSGEISVLQWSDINQQKKSIYVTKALKNINSTEIDIGAPKTKKSKREIDVDDYTIQLLCQLRERQKIYLEEIHQENPDNYIFITQRRESRKIIPVTPSYLYMWLRKEARKCKLPLIKVHAIRHMAASYALASGAPLQGVQNMMGHTSLKTTSIYLHLMEEQKQQTANVLSAKLAALRTDDKK